MGFVRKIVVVEDDTLFRELLHTQLSAWGFEVRNADSASQALAVCRSFDPDGVILDVDLGDGPNGFQLAEALGRRMPHLAVVFLTRFPDTRESISRMSPTLRHAAFVNKSAVAHSDDVLRAINAALNDAGAEVKQNMVSSNPLSDLTRTQLEVLRLMHDGLTNAQIAEARSTSLSAVNNLVGRIFKSLKVDQLGSNPRSIAVRMYSESLGYGGRTTGSI